MEGNTFACIKEGNSYTKMDKIYLESNRKCVKDLFYLHLTLKRFKNILLLFYWIINIKKIFDCMWAVIMKRRLHELVTS
jgi:hypothetical protein